MANMNSRNRKKWYAFLVKRDGAQCNDCGISDKVKFLIVDHIDNNSAHNTAENLQLLCRSCNFKKNPRRTHQQNPRPIQGTVSPVMQKSKQAERLFVEWLTEYLKEFGTIEYISCLNDGAFKAGCSQQAIVRYIKKHARYHGAFNLYEDESGHTQIQIQGQKEWYKFLANRDGAQCKRCGRSSGVCHLEPSHIDNNILHNTGTNLCLLCKKCRDYTRRKDKRNTGHTRPNQLVYSEEVYRNTQAEPVFVKWLTKYLKKNTHIEYDECLNHGAFKADCSAQTIQRYIRKHTGIYGAFKVSEDDTGARFVHLKE